VQLKPCIMTKPETSAVAAFFASFHAMTKKLSILDFTVYC